MASRQTYASIAGGKRKAEGQEEKSSDKQKSARDGSHPSDSKHQSYQTSQHKDSNHKESSSKPQSNKSPSQGGGHISQRSGPYRAEEYVRPSQYIPKTNANRRSPSPNGETEQHYILSLLTDSHLHNYMTGLRKKYFPPKINRLDAHITLFHALPGSRLEEIKKDVEDVCSKQRPFPIVAEEATSPKMVNILINASSPKFAIEGVHKLLRTRWEDFLSEQDNRGIRPHYTVLNKVDDKREVEKALMEIQKEFQRTEGQVQGLVLWRYERGYWKDKEVFEFGKTK